MIQRLTRRWMRGFGKPFRPLPPRRRAFEVEFRALCPYLGLADVACDGI
jgi:hypothetical protein